MYSAVKTDSFVEGYSATPIITLADEFGGRVQIVKDDGCYLPLILTPGGEYRPASWIFPELHAALADLPRL